MLLSGGMDSAALAWWLRPELAVFVNYGQRPAVAEERASVKLAGELGIPLEVVSIDCSSLGSGQLAGHASLPDAPTPEWWPYRNQLLITIAGAVALRCGGVNSIIIGSVAEDAINGDGSAAFRSALSNAMRVQEGGVGLEAPAAGLSSVELVRKSGIPATLLGWSHSCFVSDTPCLKCRGCNKHLHVRSCPMAWCS